MVAAFVGVVVVDVDNVVGGAVSTTEKDEEEEEEEGIEGKGGRAVDLRRGNKKRRV